MSPLSSRRAPRAPKGHRSTVVRIGALALGALTLGVAAFAALGFAPRAHACHTVSQFGTAWARPSSTAEVGVEYADFRLGERHGAYQLVAPSLEWAPHQRVSLAVRIPIARVTFRTGASSSGSALGIGLRQALLPAPNATFTASGLGDLGTSVKVGLWTSERFSFSLGLGAELPTGDEATGLGGGHVELAPFATFSMRVSARLSFFGLITDRFALGHASADMTMDKRALVQKHVMAGESESLHGSVLMPHSDHELAVRVGAAYTFERAYVSAGAEQVLVWAGENGGLVLRAEVGAVLGAGLRLAVGYDAPVLGAERFVWRGRLGLQWAF